MDRGNTKQEILDAALELFSVQGFEATSIAQIAGAVGIRKASLYSHFENKQAILDALVQEVLEQYEEHSLFARADWEKDAGSLPQTADDAVQKLCWIIWLQQSGGRYGIGWLPILGGQLPAYGL